jgi:chromosome segregation ATPase
MLAHRQVNPSPGMVTSVTPPELALDDQQCTFTSGDKVADAASGDLQYSFTSGNRATEEDNGDLQSVFARINSEVRALLSRSASSVGSDRDSSRQILKYISFVRDSAELSSIESQIGALSAPTPRRLKAPRAGARRLRAKLKAAERKIAELLDAEEPTQIRSMGMGKDVAERAVSLTHEKESVETLKSEVEFLDAKLVSMERRIMLMTQKGSVYGQPR